MVASLGISGFYAETSGIFLVGIVGTSAFSPRLGTSTLAFGISFPFISGFDGRSILAFLSSSDESEDESSNPRRLISGIAPRLRPSFFLSSSEDLLEDESRSRRWISGTPGCLISKRLSTEGILGFSQFGMSASGFLITGILSSSDESEDYVALLCEMPGTAGAAKPNRSLCESDDEEECDFFGL